MADEVDYEEDEYFAEGESTAKGESSKSKIKVKGRGHGSAHMDQEDKYEGRGGIFETIEQSTSGGPAQCK